MAPSARRAALRAVIFIALAALARASPPPLDCCGDGTCALECTEGCAATECAACCDPCAGVVCPPPTAQCKVAGTCSGAGVCAEADAAAGAACDFSAPGDGMCDGAGACAPAAPAGSWAAVSQGNSWGCGVDTAQRAWCFGTNTNGALGQGLPVGPGRRRLLIPAYTAQTQLPLPALVLGGLSFTSISAGAEQVCGTSPEGAMFCWGAPPRRAAAKPPPRACRPPPTPPSLPRRRLERQRAARRRQPRRRRRARGRLHRRRARDLVQGRRRL